MNKKLRIFQTDELFDVNIISKREKEDAGTDTLWYLSDRTILYPGNTFFSDGGHLCNERKYMKVSETDVISSNGIAGNMDYRFRFSDFKLPAIVSIVDIEQNSGYGETYNEKAISVYFFRPQISSMYGGQNIYNYDGFPQRLKEIIEEMDKDKVATIFETSGKEKNIVCMPIAHRYNDWDNNFYNSN